MLPLRFTKSHYSGFFSVVMLCNFAVKHCNQGLTFRRWLDIRSAHKAGAYPSSGHLYHPWHCGHAPAPFSQTLYIGVSISCSCCGFGLAGLDLRLRHWGTCDLSRRCSFWEGEQYRSRRSGAKVEISGTDFQGADVARRLLHRSGCPRSFQEVVHSSGTREADCDEQSSFRGPIEWTFTRMPD